MATTTTLTTPNAWSPDVVAFTAADVIPSALVLNATTVVGSIEGDAPAVRVPWVKDDGEAGFVPEGTPIAETDADLAETVITSGKVASLAKYSREQLEQPQAAQMVVNSMQRSVITKANAAFIANAGGPTGLLEVEGITDGGALADDLDPLAQALATIEGGGGTATHLLAAPSAWARVSTLRVGAGYNVPLLGAATDTPTRQVLGVPVTVTPAVPEDTMLVVDSSSIVSAVGQVLVTRSDDVFFDSDSVGVRVTFRLGWQAMHPERIVKISTATV